MGAPTGNQFWKLRSKHGRDKLFESPQLLWESACEYFEWCDNNPFLESKPMVVSNGQMAGSEVQMIEIPIKRPYTLHGLCLYCNANTGYFRVFKSQERANSDDFKTVIAEIEETIYNQQFSGAASGFLNANIIARNLGLKDSTDITSGGEKMSPLITTMIDGKIIDGSIK